MCHNGRDRFLTIRYTQASERSAGESFAVCVKRCSQLKRATRDVQSCGSPNSLPLSCNDQQSILLSIARQQCMTPEMRQGERNPPQSSQKYTHTLPNNAHRAQRQRQSSADQQIMFFYSNLTAFCCSVRSDGSGGNADAGGISHIFWALSSCSRGGKISRGNEECGLSLEGKDCRPIQSMREWPPPLLPDVVCVVITQRNLFHALLTTSHLLRCPALP